MKKIFLLLLCINCYKLEFFLKVYTRKIWLNIKKITAQLKQTNGTRNWQLEQSFQKIVNHQSFYKTAKMASTKSMQKSRKIQYLNR